MPTWVASAWNAIHLYRHLLREASYLPPACRPYATSQLQRQFRQHRRDLAPERRLKKASRVFRSLRAANSGDLPRMRKILLLTFGRMGRRRRELGSSLRRQEPPANTAELEERVKQTIPEQDWLDKWDTKKLLAFAKSQAAQNMINAPRPEIRGSKLDPSTAVPPVNAWGRPFAKKVARSKVKKWWIGLAHRIMPPVGKGEWDTLRELATGAAGAAWKVPRRRASPSVNTEEDEWSWEEYATKPVRSVDRLGSRRFRMLSGSASAADAIGVHNYTARLWRRLYAEIWEMTATMEKDVTRNKWKIDWGKILAKPTPPSPVHREFFDEITSQER